LRLLLDAHYAFWIALKRDRLSKNEVALLSDPATEIFVSSISIWELRIKWEKRFISGARKGEASPKDVLLSLNKMGIPIIDFTGHQAAEPLTHPVGHKDPFDELMLTLAQDLGMKLLTRDKKLKGHPLAYFA
jgi:PIN domain nuclease of toxin-antitoxin system